MRCRKSSFRCTGPVIGAASNSAIWASVNACMSALARYALCHAPVRSRAEGNAQRERHPSRARAFRASSLRQFASCGCGDASRLPVQASLPQAGAARRRPIARAACPRPQVRSSRLRRTPRPRHAGAPPAAGSPQAVRARAATAAPRRDTRSTDRAPLSIARRQSGTRRSVAQSPPPITLPARAVAIATPCSEWREGWK